MNDDLKTMTKQELMLEWKKCFPLSSIDNAHRSAIIERRLNLYMVNANNFSKQS